MGVSKVYNLMVPALVVTVDKLDLSTESDIEDEEDKVDRGNEMDTGTLSETQVTVSQPSCDQTKVLPPFQATVSQSLSFAVTTPKVLGVRQKACKVKDHTVMVNLATLACHALPLLPSSLAEWAPTLWRTLGAWASSHPQVSAWYKLARTLVKEVTHLDTRTNSLVVSFLSEVAEMTPSFQEELQLSCFQLILETPSSCLEALLPSLPPVISSLLCLSTSLLWLAEITLTRLTCWLDLLGEEKMDAVLRAALPLLRPHLSTNYASLIVEGKEPTTAPKKGQKRVKAGLKKLKVGERECGVRVSRLSLALLAHVSSPLKSLLLPTEEQEGESATGWLLTPLRPLELPLPDRPLQVRFDSFLPLLASLLQDSPDRRVRVAAAELLHFFTVVMVGRSATQTQEERNNAPLEPLFARLLPLLLKFSCDADTVLQSLFSPLLTQLCHWWSRPSGAESSFSSVLVEILLDGVTKKEAAPREKAASLLEEFLTWGFRQGGGVQHAKVLLAR